MNNDPKNGTFRTANMALAAYLAETVSYERLDWEGGTCYWFFKQTPELEKKVADFQGNKARNDPREYSYRLTQMRKEMHSHPNAPKRR